MNTKFDKPRHEAQSNKVQGKVNRRFTTSFSSNFVGLHIFVRLPCICFGVLMKWKVCG